MQNNNNNNNNNKKEKKSFLSECRADTVLMIRNIKKET